MRNVWMVVAFAVVSASVVRAETHRFTPTQYYNSFSAFHPPSLRVAPGDRVVTRTVDAAGVDASGATVAARPNPLTGPFYVVGAEPGDTLVVRIERLETNRSTGYSSSLMAPFAVTPNDLIARTDREPRVITWAIDKARGLVSYGGAELGTGPIALPIVPMLGCVGVAPGRKEAIASSTPGAFGGNMDYAGVVAGVTVMLPVSEPGALLFIGDGHARQGAGEVVGTGVETSMDVEFSVDVLKKPSAWPRLENETHIMVLGSARPLLEALQIATGELGRWLVSDYGLSERGASILLGQSLEYDVANVVDPSFTVVAKIRKGSIPGRGQVLP